MVLKTLTNRRDDVMIDESVIRRAVEWLAQNQNKDGSFMENGRVVGLQLQVRLYSNSC